jgi:hypothetical protein
MAAQRPLHPSASLRQRFPFWHFDIFKGFSPFLSLFQTRHRQDLLLKIRKEKSRNFKQQTKKI